MNKTAILIDTIELIGAGIVIAFAVGWLTDKAANAVARAWRNRHAGGD